MKSVVLDEKGLVIACLQCGQRNRIAYSRLGESTRCGKCKADLSPPDAPIDVPDQGVFDALIRSASLPVLVDFWAAWCGPCKMVAPEFAKVAASAAGKLIVAKVDTEAIPSLAQRYRIQAIPTFALFAGGFELGRRSGASSAKQIESFVEQTMQQGNYA